MPGGVRMSSEAPFASPSRPQDGPDRRDAGLGRPRADRGADIRMICRFVDEFRNFDRIHGRTVGRLNKELASGLYHIDK